MLLGILLSLLGVLLVVVVSRKWKQHQQLRAYIDKIPGTDGLPLLGHALEFKHDTYEYFEQFKSFCRRDYEAGIIKLWIGLKPSIIIFRANAVEGLISGSKNMSKAFWYDFFRPWLGDGVLLSTGSKWFARRKLITPSFHFKILEEFMHVFNDNATVLVSHLDKMADGPAFNIQPYMYHCMLDSICEAAMGTRINALDNCNSDYVRAVYSQSELAIHRMRYPWLWIDFIYRLTRKGRQSSDNVHILHAFSKKVIRERIAERATQGNGSNGETRDSVTSVTTGSCDDNSVKRTRKRRLAFLDMLLEAAADDPTVTTDNIQEEVDTFMFAGHDTTASASVWTLLMLGCHVELQKRVQQELDRVLGDSVDREVTMEDINELKYLDCFIKETLRLYPPVTWFSRDTSELCNIGGYDLPKGINVTVFSYLLHRDPKFFPDPEKFDPDRWLTGDLDSRHPFCYLPFSAGMRNCIGQRFGQLELKVVLCNILRKFNISCQVNRDDMHPVATAVLKPYSDVPVQLHRR